MVSGAGMKTSEFMRQFHDWWTRPQRRSAAAWLRVGLSCLMVLFLIEHVGQVALLWGPHGQVPAAKILAFGGSGAARAWSSELGTTILFVAALFISAAFGLGILPRLTSVLFLISTYAFFMRNDAILDGGQNLMIVLSFYLCFVDTSAFGCLWRLRRLDSSKAVNRVSTILHNAAMLLVVSQISIVYFWAAFYKMTGHMWQDGTALYYIMRDAAFASPVSHYFYVHASIVTLATYGTIAIEIAFAVLLWNKRFRLPLLAAIVLLHVGIAIFMGLTVFAAIMIIADTAVLDDNDFMRLQAFARRLSFNPKTTTSSRAGAEVSA
jgi:hypothetical protein